MWDPAADAYFSGLADGEATFLLNLNHRPRWGRPCVHPRFSMNLRADDVAVLRALQGAFGGRLSLDSRPQGRASRPASPRYFWHVTTKEHLVGLVRYFDRFPLRAKKATDYAIWREGVLLYAARGGADAYAELVVLREALIECRRFEAEPPAMVESPQLRLAGGA